MGSIPEIYFKEDLNNAARLEVVPFGDLPEVLACSVAHSPYHEHRLKFNILTVVGPGEHGVHRIDFKDYAFEGPCLMLIAKDQIHAFVDLPAKQRGFMLLFTEGLFLEVGAEYPLLIDHFFNTQLYGPVHALTEGDYQELQGLFVKLKTKGKDARQNIRAEVVTSYFKILLLEVFASRESQYETVKRNPHALHFMGLQQLLKAHFTIEKKVKFYAERLNLSTKKLNAITQEVVGQTAKGFIVSFIILEAKKRLIVPDMSLKEVAHELGFDEPTNFTKFFKTYTGMLPSAFAAAVLSR